MGSSMNLKIYVFICSLLLASSAACSRDVLPEGEESKMMPLNIQANLVFFYYPDLAEAERFYTGILGLEKVLDYGFAKILRISQSTFIGLVDETKGMHDPSEPKSVTLSFITDEIDGWYSYLLEQGVDMRGSLTDAARHPTRGFVAFDPAGYFLEFERFLDHPQNESLHEALSLVQPLFPDPGLTTSRPSQLGIQANVVWLYYKDIPEAQRFYEKVMDSHLLVDQGFAKVYSSSTSGFLGLVDEAQGLHRFSEKKAVNISFFTDRIDAWYAHFQSLGIRIKDPLEDSASIPVRAFVAFDPAGYYIEFDLFLEDSRNSRILATLR